MLKYIRDMGEEQITRLVTRLLSNESFVMAVQTIVSRSLRTRDQIEGGLKGVFTTLAIPSKEDMDLLFQRIVEIEAAIDDLYQKIDAVEESKGEVMSGGSSNSSQNSNRKAAEN